MPKLFRILMIRQCVVDDDRSDIESVKLPPGVIHVLGQQGTEPGGLQRRFPRTLLRFVSTD